MRVVGTFLAALTGTTLIAGLILPSIAHHLCLIFDPKSMMIFWGMPPPSSIGHTALRIGPPPTRYDRLASELLSQFYWLPLYAVLSVFAAFDLTRRYRQAPRLFGVFRSACIGALPGMLIVLAGTVESIGELRHALPFLAFFAVNFSIFPGIAAGAAARFASRLRIE